jgi:hypothetical protein
VSAADAVERGALERVVARVRRLAAGYEPPSFHHIPDPDAAVLLCAVDHQTGYEGPHEVDARGPFEGSELMWEVALRAASRRPGLLTASRLRAISADEVASVFEVEGDTVADPDRRAAMWRDLATGLEGGYGGQARVLLAASAERLGGDSGLLGRLAAFDAYSDPLQKKSFLFAKICERRGWLEVSDPENWEVCADNVLMRLALRSGLVVPGALNHVRAATREAFKRVATEAGVPPPVLDDVLWERGRDNPDLLGMEAGDLREPKRNPESAWY